MPHGGAQVRAEVEVTARQARQAGEHPDECVVRRVGGVMQRPGYAVRDLKRTLLVASVELGERVAVPRDGSLGERPVRRMRHGNDPSSRAAALKGVAAGQAGGGAKTTGVANGTSRDGEVVTSSAADQIRILMLASSV